VVVGAAGARREPLHRLAGDSCDRVEMAVVMEEGQLRALGDRCDQQVYRGRPAMLTPEGEGCLGLESTSAVGCIEGDERQLSELGATFRVVARASGGIQELQRDEIAKRDLVELD